MDSPISQIIVGYPYFGSAQLLPATSSESPLIALLCLLFKHNIFFLCRITATTLLRMLTLTYVF